MRNAVPVRVRAKASLIDTMPGAALREWTHAAAADVLHALDLQLEPEVEVGPPIPLDRSGPACELTIAGIPARANWASAPTDASGVEARLRHDLVRNAELFVTPNAVDALLADWSRRPACAAADLAEAEARQVIVESVRLGCSVQRIAEAELSGDERDPPGWRLLEAALEAALSLRLTVPPDRAGSDAPGAIAETLRSLVFAKTGVFLPPAHITVSASHGGYARLNALDIEVPVPLSDAGSAAEMLAAGLVPWLTAFVTREFVISRMVATTPAQPHLVAAVRKRFGDAFITRTCRALVSEGVGIDDFRSLLAGLLEIREPTTADERQRIVFHSPAGTAPPELALRDGRLDPEDAADCVRRWARRRVTTRFWDAGSLRARLLDPAIEDAFRTGGLQPGSDMHRRFLEQIEGSRDPILTNVDVRRRVFEVLAFERPDVAVLCYQELLPETSITPTERVSIP